MPAVKVVHRSAVLRVHLPDDENTGDSNGKKAAWVCKVNGNVCKDPANTLVKEGDKIEFFYSSGWNGMEHATADQGKSRGKTW